MLRVLRLFSAWWRHFWRAVITPTGYTVLGAFFFNLIALLGGFYTIRTYLTSDQARYRLEMIERGDAIQKALNGEHWDRISGLRSLAGYENSFDRTLPRERWDVSPADFSRAAILAFMSRFDSAQKIEPPDERLEGLKVLTKLGSAGWYEQQEIHSWFPRPIERKSFDLDFAWISAKRSHDVDADQDPINVFNDKIFTGIKLRRARFDCVQIRNTDLSRSRVSLSQFNGADLNGSSFDGAKIETSKFLGVVAPQVVFSNAIIENSSFAAQSRAVNPRDEGDAVACSNVDSRGDGSRAANLSGAKFASAQISGVFFGNADLTGADFAKSLLSYSRMTAVSAEGARFDSSIVEKTDFTGASLTSVTFDNSRLYSVIFERANLSNASFVGTRFGDPATVQTLLKAQLGGANFAKASWPTQHDVCAILKEGGVLVSDIQGWQGTGKAMSDWQRFSSPEDLASVHACSG